MSDQQHVIFGSEYSPFSVKVRSYFRYKNIPHEWRPRNRDNQAEFQKLAKLPLIPLVLSPDGTVQQDSTRAATAIGNLIYPLLTDRGLRRRMGQQADVSLSLVAHRGSGGGERCPCPRKHAER